MRIVNPYPFGDPPAGDVLRAGVARAERVVLKDDHGKVRGERADLGELAAALAIRAGGEPFDQQLRRPYTLELHDATGAIESVQIMHDGSLYWPSWNGWAELEDPVALFRWLAAAGLPEPLAIWEAQHGPDADARRAAWRTQIPEPIRAAWDPRNEELVDQDFDAYGLRQQLIDALGSEERAIAELLRWYGSGSGSLEMRPEYESLPRLLLAHWGYDPIVKTFPALEDERARAGAARYVLHGSPLTPILAAPVLALDERVRRGLVDAAQATLGAGDGARLEADLFPSALAVPGGTELVGVALTRNPFQIVGDGRSVYAVDGNDLVRFADGARTVIASVLEEPHVGVRDDVVLVEEYGTVREIAADGVVRKLPAAEPAMVEAARSRAEAWRAPPLSGLVAVAPRADEIEAWVALAHAGAEEPATARVAGRAYLDQTTASVAWRQSAGIDKIPLPGRPYAATACAGALVVAVELESASALVRVDEQSAGQPTPFDVRPDAVRMLVAARGRVFVVVQSARGVLVLRASAAMDGAAALR
jgi:hypothetical protein